MISRFAGERYGEMMDMAERPSYGAQIQSDASQSGQSMMGMQMPESTIGQERTQSTLGDDLFALSRSRSRRDRQFRDAKDDIEADEEFQLGNIRAGGGFGSAFASPFVDFGLGLFSQGAGSLFGGGRGFGSAAGRKS
ncbi:hypothetical protein VZG28_04805 [Synechococcus elongatus IITB4]|uniref:hypothetical protein n=1 Tax=Synechococcus elongatus TaxID=32046 RepID=UPI0030D112D3